MTYTSKLIALKNVMQQLFYTLGCFNPNLGQIWTNPNVGLKM